MGFPSKRHSFLESRIIGIVIVIDPKVQKFIGIGKTKVSFLIEYMYQSRVEVKGEAEFVNKVMYLSGFSS
jgi:hypothetical protein